MDFPGSAADRKYMRSTYGTVSYKKLPRDSVTANYRTRAFTLDMAMTYSTYMLWDAAPASSVLGYAMALDIPTPKSICESVIANSDKAGVIAEVCGNAYYTPAGAVSPFLTFLRVATDLPLVPMSAHQQQAERLLCSRNVWLETEAVTRQFVAVPNAAYSDPGVLVAIRLDGGPGVGVEGCVVNIEVLRNIPWLYAMAYELYTHDPSRFERDSVIGAYVWRMHIGRFWSHQHCVSLTFDARAYPHVVAMLRDWRRLYIMRESRVRRRRLFAQLAAIMCPHRARLHSIMPQAEPLFWLFGTGLVHKTYIPEVPDAYYDKLCKDVLLLANNRFNASVIADDYNFILADGNRRADVSDMSPACRSIVTSTFEDIEGCRAPNSQLALSTFLAPYIPWVAPTNKGRELICDLYNKVIDDLVWVVADYTRVKNERPKTTFVPSYMSSVKRSGYLFSDDPGEYDASLDPASYVQDLGSLVAVGGRLTDRDFYMTLFNNLVTTWDKNIYIVPSAGPEYRFSVVPSTVAAWLIMLQVCSGAWADTSTNIDQAFDTIANSLRSNLEAF